MVVGAYNKKGELLMKLGYIYLAATFAIAATATPALADGTSCQTVRLSDLGWTDIALTNASASLVLKALGYTPKLTTLSLNVTYEALKNKQMDVFLGNWRPAQDTEFKSFFDNGDVDVITTNLTGAKFTLAVPTYVADAGVRSFDDLAKFSEKFGSKIYGIEAGSNEPIVKMVANGEHGLKGWQVVESSEAGMLTQVDRVTKRNQWVVFLGWEPHPMNLKYKLTYLSGGEAEYGPDYGGATVRTITRKGYGQECPNVVRLLQNLKFDIDYENHGMDSISNGKVSPDNAARGMITERPELLKQWLAGVTTIDGRDGYDAAKLALLSK